MSAIHGKLLQISVGDNGSPSEHFTPLGSMQLTALTINRTLTDASDVASGPWRKGSSATGVSAMRLSGSGPLHQDAVNDTLRALAFSGEARHYRMRVGQDAMVQGAFIITHYSRSGEMHDAQQLELTFESAGAVSYSD